MAHDDPNRVQTIDRVHSAAICAEIGERLGDALARNPTGLPPRLLGLAHRLDTAGNGDIVFDDSNKIEWR